jgi:hypothetical protein
MAEIITGAFAIVFHTIKEILAIVSNITALYAAIMAVISLLQLISSQGVLAGTISWIAISAITSAVTGLIAEALCSAIPSPFRWIGKIIEILINLA